MSTIADHITKVNLNRQSSVNEYKKVCKRGFFTVKKGPSWIYIDSSSYELVIDVPNLVSAIKEYQFLINSWPVSLFVRPPCNIENIQGLDDDGSVTVRVDDETTLIF